VPDSPDTSEDSVRSRGGRRPPDRAEPNLDVPRRRVEPDYTQTGKLTARRLNKTDRNALYLDALAAVTINGIRRTLAAAPGASEAVAVTFRTRPNLNVQPVAWLRLARGEDVGWTQSRIFSSFLEKHGCLDFNLNTFTVKKADFSSSPELGKLASRYGSGALPDEGEHFGFLVRRPRFG
jgi:hypothetical protein